MKSQDAFSLGNIKTDTIKCLFQTERQLVNVREHVGKSNNRDVEE